MCGVLSHISSRGGLSHNRLHVALEALHHRGPDGSGTWVSPDQKIGLGHTRLSIIGGTKGPQPLHSNDGHIHAVVNGEFYGYQAIRKEFQDEGYVFQTESDSEILIPLYQKHGLDCVQYLRGEFAFILWDDREERLIAVRDRFGIKPLCYTETEDGLMVASEAKALFALGHKPAWDHDAYYHSTCLQYTPQDRTLFQGVHQVKPGHILTYTERDGLKTQRYWDVQYPESNTSEHGKDISADNIKECHDHFESALKDRLIADVPICFHLSGGLDSSAVFGLATHLDGAPQTAFTVAFEDADYNEVNLARDTVKAFGGAHHVVDVTSDDIVTALPNAVMQAETPTINGHLAAKYLLNAAIHKAGFKVAITGEGADECLAGYAHLRQDLGVSLDEKHNAASLGTMLAHGDGLDLSGFQNGFGHIPSFLAAKAGFGARMHGVLNKDYAAAHSPNVIFTQMAQDVTGGSAISAPMYKSLYVWIKYALANYILRAVGDGVEMAHSIEGRLPFLDHVFFEYAAKLPITHKINGGVEKFILREAMKPYLTPAVYAREKHPFMAPPLARETPQKLGELVGDMVHSQSFNTIPFFDADKVRSALSDFTAPASDMEPAERIAFEPVMMTILSTAILHEGYKL